MFDETCVYSVYARDEEGPIHDGEVSDSAACYVCGGT